MMIFLQIANSIFLILTILFGLLLEFADVPKKDATKKGFAGAVFLAILCAIGMLGTMAILLTRYDTFPPLMELFFRIF